ncbi:MAG: hypothetical protein CMJ18_22980 [Phycisphaeraceae bacterium]|nr:hypothetical protein [Phycisphaeraceae bacterium]
MYVSLAPDNIGHHELTLPQLIELAVAHGYGGVDPPIDAIMSMPEPQRACDAVESAGLRWGSFGLPMEFRRDDETATEGLPRVEAMAAAAKAIGCDRCATWLMPRHDELDYQENFDAHVRRLRPACRILADHGIRFGIEFVGPLTMRTGHRYEFVHTMDQALELAAAIGSDVGLLLDSFHWFTSAATIDDIRRLRSEQIALVHVNDGIAGRGPDEQIDNERALPGETGVIDLQGFFGALREIAYDGPIAVEPFMQELGDVPASNAVKRVADSLRRYGVLSG